MKTLLLIFGLIPIWQDMPDVTIVQDSAIIEMMENHWVGHINKEVIVSGWRVQVFSSNDPKTAKYQAETLRKKLEKNLDQPIYVNYIQPFWKVRIGNFQDAESAKAYRDEIVKKWPALQGQAYPVKDQIKVMQ